MNPHLARTLDFIGSVLLSAAAIWLGIAALSFAAAFIFWHQPDFPDWGALRFALVVALGLQLSRTFRKEKP